MINLESISLYRSGRQLFQDVSLIIYPGQKIGLIGKNGAGKSSFLSMLIGTLSPDSGVLNFAKSLEIASVSQSFPDITLSARDFIIQGDKAYCQLQLDIPKAEAAEDWELLTALYSELDAIDGYNTPLRAEHILRGLGFLESDFNHPISTFSGGWRGRLALGQTLMQRSSLLILDEPTNHLDMQAINWLEDWLLSYKGALIVVSHDCAFLDRVVGHILHIENEKFHSYTGNYSQFTRIKAEKSALQQKHFLKMKKKKEEMMKFIDKFRAKASKAKQAQSRLKALDRLESVEEVFFSSPFNFRFKEVPNCPNLLVDIKKADLGYADKSILPKINFSIRAGSRLGLIGLNGAGKSTLLKTLAGILPARSGELFHDNRLKVGYFAQHHVENLSLNSNPCELFQRKFPGHHMREVRDYLGGFNFTGEKAVEPIKSFSGGERARLVLALIAWEAPNLLLLDEPTNHLDLEMREALTMSLQDFQGAIVLVSHDRSLLKENCNELFLLQNGKVELFDGDIEEYYATLTMRRA